MGKGRAGYRSNPSIDWRPWARRQSSSIIFKSSSWPGFYIENPVFLMDDLPEQGLIQFLADVVGDYWPYQLMEEYGDERIRATVRGCLEVYGKFDWKAVGIEKPAGYLRSLLAKGTVPGRGRAASRGWFVEAERRRDGETKWS